MQPEPAATYPTGNLPCPSTNNQCLSSTPSPGTSASTASYFETFTYEDNSQNCGATQLHN